MNKLNRYIKPQKDRFPSSNHSRIVINYKECNASCVGQTRKLLKTKISKHKNHITVILITTVILINIQ